MTTGTFYHIYNHANGSENLFRTDENYSYFLKSYAYHIHSVADTYAYCLMPNHIHFLIRTKSESELQVFFNKRCSSASDLPNLLSKQFSNLFNSYSKAYNKMYNRKGSLFVRPFKRKEVTDNHYFTKLVHYIHTNPIHHGFSTDLNDWKFSSYHSHISEKKTRVKRLEVIDWFGGRMEFLKFHRQPIDVKMSLDMDY